ncbi:hypothetical protein GGR51DRAFT_543085 [Nemania sp. FL0031]|nr:hypothetical protein GGR51DRAFT_543085 [Nemania sp. FL0031]
MYSKTVSSIVFAAVALYSGTATALFDCQTDQHAFPPTEGKFVVHYTSIRDSNYNGQPWIRVCQPETDGDWSEVDPIQTPCTADPSTTIPKEATGLEEDLIVTNGNGCDSGSSNLDGASIAYGDQIAVLDGSAGKCGDRDHGISCEFDLTDN